MPSPRPVSRPIVVELPAHGVCFAESVHDASFQMPWRRDPFHKLIHVVRGRSVCEEAAGRETTLAAGELMVVPAGVEHRLRDIAPSVLRLLCVAPEVIVAEPGLAETWPRLVRLRPGRLQPAGGAQLRLETLWHRALLEQVHRALGHATMIRAAACQLLVQLARLPVTAGAGDAAGRVDLVVRELAVSFFEEWTLDRAAAAAGMSRRSFSAHFHRRTNRTFVAHLAELRLAHAARLLAQGHHSIVGAALASGYRDVSHFHRLWRRRHGTTPKAWARGR